MKQTIENGAIVFESEPEEVERIEAYLRERGVDTVSFTSMVGFIADYHNTTKMQTARSIASVALEMWPHLQSASMDARRDMLATVCQDTCANIAMVELGMITTQGEVINAHG